MARDQQLRKPVLRSLLRDRTANTIAISAAAMVPLMAMVGGGIDASRYYMAAARMQAACDAGALAARRAMLDDDFKPEHRDIGLNFFDQNFNDGIFGTTDRTRAFTGNSDGVVTGTASGTLPTSIMAAFGYDEFDIEVTCSAEINISNTDIMFVLDVTGSMNCPDNNIAGCTNGNNNNNEVSNSLIVGLRSAVLSFYDTVESATSPSAQVRYGIAAYSNLVNVGYSLNQNWMVDDHTYQSREPDPIITEVPGQDTTTYTRTSGASNFRYHSRPTQTYTGVTLSQCQNLTATRFDIFRSSNRNNWTLVSSSENPTVRNYTGVVTYEYYEYAGNGSYSSSTQTCSLPMNLYLYEANSNIREAEGETTTTTEFRWSYRPVTFDVSSVYGTSREMTAPTGAGGATETHTWKGCIEEADTVSGNFDPVPAGAFDHEIDLVPNTDAERWRPAISSLVFYRYRPGTTGNFWDENNWRFAPLNQTTETWDRRPIDYCPKPARKLGEITRAELDDYLKRSNGFVARGATYHDYGMLWGARFISPTGIFASENATAPNGDAIGRHIVFMTDGRPAGNQDVYGLYGVEFWDRRVTANGTSDEIEDRHAERFQAACRAARQQNITVWVVAFGTELTDELRACASPDRAYEASNNAALTTAFQEIAQKIAALRLTQ